MSQAAGQRNSLRKSLHDSRKIPVSAKDSTIQLLKLLQTPLGQDTPLSELLPAWKIKSSAQYLQQQDAAVQSLAGQALADTAISDAGAAQDEEPVRYAASPCTLSRHFARMT